MTIISVIISVLIFGAIVLVHELGHFVAAKLSGITVHQFSIGFGPALFKKRKGETLYAVRAIPLGGAVLMKGADEEEELLVGKTPEALDENGQPIDPDAGSYYSVPKWKRLIVVSAGPIMNLLCGILILFIIFAPAQALTTPAIDTLMEGFPYGQYFEPGDRFVSVNGFHAFTVDDVTTGLFLGEGKPMTITIERDGQKITYRDLPLEKTVTDTDGRTLYGFRFQVMAPNLWDKLAYSANSAMSFLQSAVKGLQMLFTGQAGVGDMMGTVGIASEITGMVEQSITQESPAQAWLFVAGTLRFVAFISVNLALMNLLPLPALDGGKILFLIIEAVRGRRVSPKVEGMISLASLVLILGLFVVVTYNDITRIITG